MKLQPMTLGRWVELILGSVFPTIAMVLLLSIGALIAFGSPPHHRFAYDYLYQLAIILLTSIVSIAPSVSSWLLTLFGPEQIIQRPFLYRFIIVTNILGLLAVFGILFGLLWFRNYSFLPYLIWIGPVAVGLRYLPRLIKGTK